MIHYTCDGCGRSLKDERYVAKIEVAAAFDPDEVTPEDLDGDHLEQIAASIAEMETTGDFELEETGPQSLQFDLCSNCCRRFLAAPLGPAPRRQPRYSQN